MNASEQLVRDVMTREPACVRDSMDIRECVEFLRSRRVSGAPVLDAGGKLVGVVTLTDLVGALGGGNQRLVPEAEFYGIGRHAAEPVGKGYQFEEADLTSVGDVMSPVLITVGEEETLGTASRILLDRHVHRVLVMRGETLTGILSALDVVRALTA